MDTTLIRKQAAIGFVLRFADTKAAVFRILSWMLLLCTLAECGIALYQGFAAADFWSSPSVLVLEYFVLPQAAGSISALLFSYRPSYQKFPAQYFILLGSIVAVMVFLFMFLPYTAIVLMLSVSNVMFAMPAIVGSIWTAIAVAYAVKSLRFA